MISGARRRGLDVTTECYPYTAGMTAIDSALFSEGWQDKYGIDYDSLQWADTGERLTASTFAEYRETGGMVIVHATPQDAVDSAVASPLTAIATDGYLRNGKGHPRTAGTYSLILGRYVRERRVLSLSDALAKCSLMPALRLPGQGARLRPQGKAPARNGRRHKPSFDPERVIDNSTYERPNLPPTGIEHVIVSGVPVVQGRPDSGRRPPWRWRQSPVDISLNPV